MKILLYNIGYGTRLNGSLLQYLMKFWRYLLAPKNTIRQITSYMNSIDADINLILEVDDGSPRARFTSQVCCISKILNTSLCASECKYGSVSLWRSLPYYKHCHNAIFSRFDGQVHSHYLNHGLKRLVFELELDTISIFLVHLSRIGKGMRKKQLSDLTKILKNHSRPYLVCGDFNAFGGVVELDDFIKENDLIVSEQSLTFPSVNPTKKLDFILATKNLNVNPISLVDVQYSDHLPILVEVSYSTR